MIDKIKDSMAGGESNSAPPVAPAPASVPSATPQGESKSVLPVAPTPASVPSAVQNGINDDLTLMNSIQQVYDDISSTREALWEQARERPELYKVLYSTHAAWFTRTLTYLHIRREMIYHRWNIQETCDRFPDVDRGIIELIRDCPRPEWLGTIGVEPDISAQALFFIALLQRRLGTPYPGKENSNIGPLLHDSARSINEALLAKFDYKAAYAWSKLIWRTLSGQMLNKNDIMEEIFSVLGIDATLLNPDYSVLEANRDRQSVQDLSKAFKKFRVDKANPEKTPDPVEPVPVDGEGRQTASTDKGQNAENPPLVRRDAGLIGELPNNQSDDSDSEPQGEGNNEGIFSWIFGNEAPPPVLSDPR